MDYLGKRVRCRVTGFEGTVTGQVEYLTGCNQLLVIPVCDSPNKMPDGQWLDVQRCTVLDAPTLSLENGKTPGGFAPPPIR